MLTRCCNTIINNLRFKYLDDPGARRKAKAVSKASASTAEASTQDSYGGDDLGRADAYDNSPALSHQWIMC